MDTAYAGIWLLVPLLIRSGVLRWLKAITFGIATSITPLEVFLNLFIVALCSIRRIWHLNDLTDKGLSLFTGRRSLLDQGTVSRLLSRIKAYSFHRLRGSWVKSMVSYLKGKAPLIVGIDDHTTPYWGKLKLAKTKIATRGKVMKATKFFYCYATTRSRIIDFDTTGAHHKLSQRLLGYIQSLRLAFGIRQRFIFLFDKGGYKAQNFEQLNRSRVIHYVSPAKNTSGNTKQWNKIPANKYRDFIHPTKGKPFKMTITRTKLKGLGKSIRTILLKSKKGYQGFFTNFIRLKAKQIIKLYQSHWAQETSYRILKNDLGLDYLPKRKKKNPKKDRLNTTAISFATWVKSFTFNLLKDFGACLGKHYERMHAETLIRKFIARPGKISIYSDRLLVALDPFRDQEVLRPYVANINRQCLTIPWLRSLPLEIAVSPGKYTHKKGNYL